MSVSVTPCGNVTPAPLALELAKVPARAAQFTVARADMPPQVLGLDAAGGHVFNFTTIAIAEGVTRRRR